MTTEQFPSAKTTRLWTILHWVSLAAVALLFLKVAAHQWFFYDEWDFLLDGKTWDLLAPHNGHLSFSPALIFAIIKSFVGLNAYWPYLAVTVVIHLAIAHFLWRTMIRSGVVPVVSLLLSLVFAVLGAGADNSLWAFQTGFITPILLGLIALPLIERPSLRVRDLVWITVLLFGSLTFASTAIPIVGVLGLLVLVRHGWKPLLVVAAPVVLLYAPWFVFVGLRDPSGSGYRAATVNDFVVRVPEYFAHGVIDSFSQTVPFPTLVPALIVAFGLWAMWTISRVRIRYIPGPFYLVLAALLFGALTAYTRVQLGDASASAGRYVYVYFALCVPALGMAISFLVRRSVVTITVAALILGVVAAFNVGQLVVAARNQAGLEQATRQGMSAALAIGEQGGVDGGVRPLPVLAPPLTLDDIREFQRTGEFKPVPYTPSVELSALVNMKLRATAKPGPRPAMCVEPTSDGVEKLESSTKEALVWSGSDSTVDIMVAHDGVLSEFTRIVLKKGLNEVGGTDFDWVGFKPGATDDICIPSTDSSSG